MKLIIFGVGGFYKYRRKILYSCLSGDEIIAFVDNKAKYNQKMDGKSVFSPIKITEIDFDIIVIMSNYYRDIKEQLIGLNVPNNKIYFWEQYICEKFHGKLSIYTAHIDKTEKPKHKNKRLLLIMEEFGYNGGTMALIYAGSALKSIGYNVTMAAGKAELSLVEMMTNCGLNVIIAPAIPYVAAEDLFWIRMFDAVIVNTFQMVYTVNRINNLLPMIWWLHEPRSFYVDTQYKFANECKLINDLDTQIVAVSNVAKDNFEYFYPKKIGSVLPFGIPDEQLPRVHKNSDKIIFAVIGALIPLKAQDIFLRAAALVPKSVQTNIEYWLIGASVDKVYVDHLDKLMEVIPNAKMLGIKSRAEMLELFCYIDVVVCPSWQESFSMVIVEGMMHSKLCITNLDTGVSIYIEDGSNGFIFETGNVDSLYTKMMHIIIHKDELDAIRKEARKTYEEHFSMRKFSERLVNELYEAEEHFYGKVY